MNWSLISQANPKATGNNVNTHIDPSLPSRRWTSDPLELPGAATVGRQEGAEGELYASGQSLKINLDD